MAWNNKPRPKEHHQLIQWAQANLPQHCNQCGNTEHLELDHIRNLARGGTNTTNNIQWLCQSCHKAKTAYESGEWRRKVKRTTRKPIGLT